MDINISKNWPKTVIKHLLNWNISLLTYIPDAGNTGIIKMAETQNSMKTVLLTTEEEGIAVCAGADLVGGRGIVCMQSSGIGNCPNFLSLVKGGHFPIFMIISMRGEYGEQNPWQYPMGQAVKTILTTMGVLSFEVTAYEDLEQSLEAALSSCFKGGQASALILSQKFLGTKNF